MKIQEYIYILNTKGFITVEIWDFASCEEKNIHPPTPESAFAHWAKPILSVSECEGWDNVESLALGCSFFLLEALFFQSFKGRMASQHWGKYTLPKDCSLPVK